MTSTLAALIMALAVLSYIAHRLRHVGTDIALVRYPPLVERRSGNSDRRSGQDRRAASRDGSGAGRRSGERRYNVSRLWELNGLG